MRVVEKGEDKACAKGDTSFSAVSEQFPVCLDEERGMSRTFSRLAVDG